MYGFIIAIHILASIFLILVILLQAGRSGGFAEGFGGAVMQNIFGSSSQTVLTKITTVCAVIFISTSLLLTILTTRSGKSLIELQKGKVAGVVAAQKSKPIPVPKAGIVEKQQAPQEKTVTVKEVKVDPVTGKETVVKEEKMTPEEAANRGAAQNK